MIAPRSGLFEGDEIDLASLLAARETRVARRGEVHARFAWPVVSVTPVMPGPIKDCAASRLIQTAAVGAARAAFEQRAWATRIVWSETSPAGPEAFLVVEARASDIKQVAIDLEDSHPLGRLWDLDVSDPQRGVIARRDLAAPARRCLVCGEPAHACGRARTHPLEALRDAIEAMIDAACVR